MKFRITHLALPYDNREEAVPPLFPFMAYLPLSLLYCNYLSTTTSPM